jgi:1-acyl-sn-glycerol-3-phosphate acyltransferase/nucleoside-diphosphate-sugar epimerase
MALISQQPAVPLEDGLFESWGKTLLIFNDKELGEIIGAEIVQSGIFRSSNSMRPGVLDPFELLSAEAIVYFPSSTASLGPDLAEAEAVFRSCVGSKCCSFVLVGSAAIYGASFRHPGMINESFRTSNADISGKWKSLERLAHDYWGLRRRLTILRCTTLLTPSHPSPITPLFASRMVATPLGHDPSIQILSRRDLAQAITCVLKARRSGVFNVSPDECIPLRQALRNAGVKRIPLPRTVLRIALSTKAKRPAGQLDYSRYSWTVSNQALKSIGFQPQCSSAQALVELRSSSKHIGHVETGAQSDVFDTFGMDKHYIDFYGRTLFKFLADMYWRIEVAGTEHIPAEGRGMLVGMHRGFMPWDGVMALHLIVRNTGRYPRFLIHPGLVKFPFLANFMTKLGGIIACQENAAYVLGQNELLGVFPEGIHGAFVKYAQAYQIQHFHRDTFVKMALVNRTPIIPFVTVGSAEIFPILADIKCQLWTNYSEWPALPITPTFPILPVPLPSKWHTRFLEPMHIENDYGPEHAADASIVRHISSEVRSRMQNAIDEMLQRRRSVFFGSIFARDAR